MNKTKQNKRAYQQIDLWKRKELIDSVNRKEETMKECAQRLGINYCTAKHIMKVYRRSGSYETDLMRKKKQKEQTLKERVLGEFNFAQIDASQQKLMLQAKADDNNSHDSTRNHLDEHVQSSKPMYNCGFVGQQMTQPDLYMPVQTLMNQNYQNQLNFCTDLNHLCSCLGERIFQKFSF